ncbi:hypothetical protein TWF694_009283 [Orbilia ellipsospora]|uniref:Uncharacterized protein n=1 Tax=Orbilia ellipsospora TaxID=2528407 RepID=A0AAV9XF15_9PEZI
MKFSIVTIALGILVAHASAQNATSTTPESTPAFTIPASTSTACPGAFDVNCTFACGGGAPGLYSCSQYWAYATLDTGCQLCPHTPTTCPAASDPQCAFLCKPQDFEIAPITWCSPTDLTGQYNTLCSACPGGSTGTGTSGGSTSNSTVTSVLPPPTYSSESSVLTMSGGFLLGLGLTMLMAF